MTPEPLGHDNWEALRDTVAHYRTLFDAMDEAYCVIEMLFDHEGTPTD